MTLLEFSARWIEINVDTELYPEMAVFVQQFVDLLIQQNHSGASEQLVLKYFITLMDQYDLGDR